MFRVSRRLDYGLQLMIALASDYDKGSQTTSSLAEKLAIPLPFLYQISHSLIRAGLIKAFSGPRGGLQLIRPANQICISQIFQAIEGSLTINPCMAVEDRGDAACVTAALWQDLETEIADFFNKKFLHELVQA